MKCSHVILVTLTACCIGLIAHATTAESPLTAAIDSSAKSSSPAITPQLLAQYKKEFESNPHYRVMQNAITKTSLNDIATNRAVVAEADHTFSNVLDSWKVTNQQKSGRCWMFAGCNLLRADAIESMEIKDFELSQNWVMFWDKIEKCNYFLEAIIETRERKLGDRTLDYLLRSPQGDGGQWNMFASLVKKYGLVPKVAMPETDSSSGSGAMNGSLNRKLRECAINLRNAHESGSSEAELRVTKQEMMSTIYRILSIHLGTPPESFLWQWKDKKGDFHREGKMTPHEFADKYIDIPFDEYICLVDDPRSVNPKGKVYTVEYLGNVAGGDEVRYLNVEIELIKELTMKAILNGEPVWFGCDTGKMLDRTSGVWDARLFDYESVYNTTFDMTKEERVLYGDSKMNHAMVFTGVDVVDGKPRKWRVENSWGKESGDEGFFLMNDSWFNEYVFEIAVRKDMLPSKYRDILDEKAIKLPAWDPMGSLAR